MGKPSAVATEATKENGQTAAVVTRQLPQEISGFHEQRVEQPWTMTADAWECALRETETNDNKQKIRARPFLAWGVGVLLLLQNVGVWFIVVWALHRNVLTDLQLIFSTLIAGSLTQSYFLLRLITEKVFGDIDYHNNPKKSSSAVMSKSDTIKRLLGKR